MFYSGMNLRAEIQKEQIRGQLHERLRKIVSYEEIFTYRFYVQSNFKKFWTSMERALLDMHFMTLLEELTHSKFLKIR